MRNVESDQRWGVGVTADAGTDFANKNGWLGVDDDNGLWLVNSTGVVTINGQQVLMVVLTQHDSDFQSGDRPGPVAGPGAGPAGRLEPARRLATPARRDRSAYDGATVRSR